MGVGWQDCQSSPTCTLHPQRLTSLWQENLHALSNWGPHNFVVPLHALSPLSHSPHAQALGGLGLTQTFSSLPDGAEYSHTPNFASSLCFVRSPPLSVRYSSYAPDFPGFTTQFFLCGRENGVALSFTHRMNCGFGIVIVHAPVGRL